MSLQTSRLGTRLPKPEAVTNRGGGAGQGWTIGIAAFPKRKVVFQPSIWVFPTIGVLQNGW